MHRGRRVEDWVELTASAIAKARATLGDEEVARRAALISNADRETVVRVLRTLGRDLQADAPVDITALDARLRQRAGATGAAAGWAIANNPADGDPSEGNPADGNSSKGGAADGNPTEANPSEDDATEGDPSEGNPADGNSSHDNPTGANAAEGNPANGNPCEGNPADGNPTEDDTTAANPAADAKADPSADAPRPIRPADLAKQLARLRNPILPHPRRKPGNR